VTSNEKFKLLVKGYATIDCQCIIVKSLGSKGFKMTVETSKLTKKDVGVYIIQADISLEGGFKTESETFKLTITGGDDDESSNNNTSANET